MHMVDHQVSLLNLRLSLLGQIVKNFAQMLAKFSVQGLAAVFRDKYDVVLAFPLRMVQALIGLHDSLLLDEPRTVHRKETFFDLYGIVKLLESPGIAGGLPLELDEDGHAAVWSELE